MSIHRSGDCPEFIRYVTEWGLIPRANPVSPQFQQLTLYSFKWIDIPSYQRGLVWDDELFQELLDSTSVFIGNAILGNFPVPPNDPHFTHLPPGVSDYAILIDGLQRFSIGTALLTLLYPQVLAPQPLRPADAPHFTALAAKAQPAAPIFQHNDTELENHHRIAVRDSYGKFKRMLGSWLTTELERQGGPASLARKLNHLLLVRQIAPDLYFGFANKYDVTKTFIGLNTIRVELNIVDWLRSIIVDTGATVWNDVEIERIENRFTEVFTRGGRQPETELLPFAAITKAALENPTSAPSVFPTWNTSLSTIEVETFLDFVDEMFAHKDNPYFRELRATGSIPFAGCISYYYKLLLQTGNRPSFLSNGSQEDAELLDFLRGNYRVLFDGQIGRTREFAERLLLVANYSISQAADEMSSQYLQIALNQPVDIGWLKATLRQTNQKRAARAFNACLLPAFNAPQLSFEPQLYGRRTQDYQIDHLIPDTAFTANHPGELEGQFLANFAPVRRSANNRQTNLQCSTKLDAGGSYESEVNNDPTAHPYVAWLVHNQRHYHSDLDRQELLQTLSTPAIADERITWLGDRLIQRL